MELRRSVVVAVVVGLSMLLWGASADAQCTKDTDCKGDRICRAGACGDPVPPSAPPTEVAPTSPSSAGKPLAPATTCAPAAVDTAQSIPEPQSHNDLPSRGLRSLSGYASIATLASLHSWFGDNGKENLAFGGYVAGHWALNPLFHPGVFFHAHKFNGQSDAVSHDGGHLGAGVSMKFGGCPTDRIWLGGAMDLGVHIAIGTSTSAGAEVFPRFEIDGQLVQSGNLKLGLFGSFGPMFAPALKDYTRSGLTGTYVSLQMLAGLIIGG